MSRALHLQPPRSAVREIKRGYYKAAHAIEDRVEENKRKHYVSGGI